MPEIAECFTIAKKMNSIGKVKKITISNDFEKYINKSKTVDLKILRKATFKEAFSYGKNILIPFKYKNGTGLLLSKLGMSGSWFNNNNFVRNEKHNHLIIEGDNGTLIYSDPRKFGSLYMFLNTAKSKIFNDLKIGLDPRLFTLKNLIATVSPPWLKSGKEIKSLLLDQNLISGIGNYLASEILFEAQVSPYRKGHELKENDIKQIIKCTKKIINKAIKKEGFSFAGGYLHPDGSFGKFSEVVKVYGKEGMSCPQCKKEKLSKEFIKGRSTFYCKKCQK